MAEFIETSLLLAALNDNEAEGRRLVQSMLPAERRLFRWAMDRIEAWFDDAEEEGDESERKSDKP